MPRVESYRVTHTCASLDSPAESWMIAFDSQRPSLEVAPLTLLSLGDRQPCRMLMHALANHCEASCMLLVPRPIWVAVH